MEHNLRMEKVKAQLMCELIAIRDAERDSARALNLMRRADPFDDMATLSNRLRRNQQMAHVHYERALAVFELLGADIDDTDANAEALEAAIEALK